MTNENRHLHLVNPEVPAYPKDADPDAMTRFERACVLAILLGPALIMYPLAIYGLWCLAR